MLTPFAVPVFIQLLVVTFLGFLLTFYCFFLLDIVLGNIKTDGQHTNVICLA